MRNLIIARHVKLRVALMVMKMQGAMKCRIIVLFESFGLWEKMRLRISPQIIKLLLSRNNNWKFLMQYFYFTKNIFLLKLFQNTLNYKLSFWMIQNLINIVHRSEQITIKISQKFSNESLRTIKWTKQMSKVTNKIEFQIKRLL